jgi:AraC-like DNA-binding protein
MRPRPLPAVTVGIELGDDLLMLETVRERRTARSAVAGLGHRPTRITGRGVDHLELRMAPFTAFTLLGGVLPEPNGSMVSLEDLWGPYAAQVTEQLASRKDWDTRFAVIETALADRLSSGPAPDPEVRRAWRCILVSGGSIRIDQLATECGWSRKRLWSRFTAQIGITPKRAAMLVRFDAAARRLEAGQDPGMVAVSCGYADQAHLHRDVREFAACTPRELAAVGLRHVA